MSSKTDSSQEAEYLAIHQERFKILLQTIADLQLPTESKILDVGCYPPYVFNQLKDTGYNMFGIASYHESMADPQIQVVDIEREKLPYETGTFDALIFTEVLEHMTATPDFYMKEFHRVLKKGGRLIITTPNSVNLKNRIKLLFGKSVTFPLFQLYETTPDNGFIYHRHTREFTLEEVKEVIALVGFTVDQATQYSAYTPFRAERAKQLSLAEKIFKLIGYFITQLAPSLKDSLLVVAKK